MIIPEYLRYRHRLELDDSRKMLAPIVHQECLIDIFINDSLHTDEHMRFEYEAAWPHLVTGGLLLSDDATWIPAFYAFSRSQNRDYARRRFRSFEKMIRWRRPRRSKNPTQLDFQSKRFKNIEFLESLSEVLRPTIQRLNPSSVYCRRTIT